MSPPFTGSALYDAPIAILLFFFGLWLVVRSGNRLGFLIMAVCAFWGYKLFF